jgi:hypothetical protein
MRDEEIREALNQHWAASDSGDFVTEHGIYHDDAFLDYSQSHERIRGHQNIQTTRTLQPKRTLSGHCYYARQYRHRIALSR